MRSKELTSTLLKFIHKGGFNQVIQTHTIDKQIDFCFGHRVWTQNLDAKFSIDDLCKCRHLH